jgi:hypothetical protein
MKNISKIAAEILARNPGYGLKSGKIIWEKVVKIGDKKYHVYVTAEKDGRFGGVIDYDDTDETVFGDVFKTKEIAMAKIKKELAATKHLKSIGW